ncbi:MAG: winged helix-turn-helix transcriptional regulator [Clostridiales bacterium]|nr:winged helix-turn-helix transcriptional regulator [Clostridiales bacterium]
MDYSDLAAEVMMKTGRMMKSSFWPKKANAFLHGEMFILNYLVNQNEDALPSELAAAMNTSTARVAMALKSLEMKGLIQRRNDRDDRRKVIVSITNEGSRVVLNEREEMRDRMAMILRELGEKDVREYVRIVDRITEISLRIFNVKE